MMSQTGEYAIRAMSYMARRVDQLPVQSKEIASETAIPSNYLSKILHTLVQVGILTSTRGLHGGFRFAKPPEEIRLFDVVDPFDHLRNQKHCILGQPECDGKNPCALHEQWASTQDSHMEFLENNSVAVGACVP